MCAPSGQRSAVGVVVARSGSRWRSGGRGSNAGSLARPARSTSGVPFGQRPHDLGRELLLVAVLVQLGGVARASAGTARRPGGACATPCRCRCARAARRRVRQPPLWVDAAVLVLVAEDELARRERPPARRPSAARRRRGRAVRLAGALDRRLGEAVGEAEVLARAVPSTRGLLLVDDRQARVRVDRAAQRPRAAASSAVSSSALIVTSTCASPVPSARLPAAPGRSGRRRRAAARGRAMPCANSFEKLVEQPSRHAERAEARAGERHVQVRLRLGAGPLLARS